MKAAAELVVHPALGHLAQRQQHHVEGFLVARFDIMADQEIMNAGAGKLGRSAKAAEPGIESAPEALESGFERAAPRHRMAGIDRRILTELLHHLRAGMLDSRAI